MTITLGEGPNQSKTMCLVLMWDWSCRLVFPLILLQISDDQTSTHRKRQSKGSRVWCILSHQPVCLQVDPNTASARVPHVPPAVAPPPVLRPDWETLTWLASRRSKPSDLDVCPAPSSLCRFCGATDKPNLAWFWGPNQETIAVNFSPKSPNCSYRFWGPNRCAHLGPQGTFRWLMTTIWYH
jgi:hypothetical protein